MPRSHHDPPTEDAAAPGFSWWRHLVGNALWLLLPILLLNGLYADRLPAGFQPALFDAAIPLYIALPEQILRLITFVVAAFVPLSLRSRSQRVGFVLLCGGSIVYAASWWMLIADPTGAYAASAAGFLAPAYTPALWLAGLVLLSERTVIPWLPFRRWIYGAVAAAFLLAHNAHAALVYSRLP